MTDRAPLPAAPPDTIDLALLAQRIMDLHDSVFRNPLAVLFVGSDAVQERLVHLSALTEAYALVTHQRPPQDAAGEYAPVGSPEGQAWVDQIMVQISAVAEAG